MSDCADGLKRLAIGFLLVFVTVRMSHFYSQLLCALHSMQDYYAVSNYWSHVTDRVLVDTSAGSFLRYIK